MTATHYLLPAAILLLSTIPARCQSASGRVLDVLGDPIPAAMVEFLVAGKVVRKTFTDGEGVYMIASPPAAGSNLRISKRGKASTELQWRGHRTQTVRNATLRDAGTVRGRVTDALGQAIANIDVVAVFGNDSLRTQTDANGDYALHPVPLGPISVSVWNGECATQRQVHLRGDSECHLRVPASQAVRRQIRIHGLPKGFAGGSVAITHSELALRGNGSILPVAPDGTASLLIQEMSIVTPSLEGFTTQPLGRIACGGTSDLHFHARPINTDSTPRRIKGKLRTTLGKVARDATLYFHDRSNLLLGKCEVDRSGHFDIQLPRTHTGILRVALSLDQWELADHERTVQDGFSWVPVYDSDDDMRLLVNPTGIVQGIIMDANKTLLPLADITATRASQPQRPLATTACNQGGQFHVALPEDRYDLLAVTYDGRVCQSRVDVRSGGAAPKIQWQTVATGTATGVVRDANGEPIPGIELFFASVEIQNDAAVHSGNRQKARVFTDRLGRFRCRGLPTGEWTVVASNHPELGTTAVQIKLDTETTLQIAP